MKRIRNLSIAILATTGLIFGASACGSESNSSSSTAEQKPKLTNDQEFIQQIRKEGVTTSLSNKDLITFARDAEDLTYDSPQFGDMLREEKFDIDSWEAIKIVDAYYQAYM